MQIFTKECLENVRQRVDLVDVLSAHIELKKTGASYKALCPFHDEKSPSFVVQKGDTHYHCFGCGAHGDAIAFLMTHLKMGFVDSVESLAQRFNVPLDFAEAVNTKGPNKGDLKAALDCACRLFHFLLLHTPEGHETLDYLFNRGIDLDFIRQFQIGLAPKSSGILRKTLHAKFISDEIMAEAGLLTQVKEKEWRDFFHDRITFPIRDSTGGVIGFSARKYKEETFGGKYVNTTETPLFKKSKVLFGLNYCRKKIAKERKAIIVEGQIDALRLIQAGFNLTVAGQGTAFGEGHVKELIKLGVNQIFLALDSDAAGQEAAVKIGNLFQKEGIEVRVTALPPGADPDSYVREYGSEAFLQLLEQSLDYLTFLVHHETKKINIDSPAGKNELVRTIAQMIYSWEQPLMVHESLKKVASLLHVPDSVMGLDQIHTPNIYIKKSASIGLQSVNPDRILETDFLRWLFLCGREWSHFIQWAEINIKSEDMRDPICLQFYQTYLKCYKQNESYDLAILANQMPQEESQVWLGELMQKKVNREKAEPQFSETIQKILDRNWMQKREEIKIKIQTGQCSDDEVLELVKSFEEIKRCPPQIIKPLPQ
jgi:DNA primase